MRVLSKHNERKGRDFGRENKKHNDPRIIIWLNVGKGIVNTPVVYVVGCRKIPASMVIPDMDGGSPDN